MPTSPIDTDENDFVLKHRIAGAAFLLFFGALVLPWLLGAPSDAKKTQTPQPVEQTATQEYVPEDLESEVLAQLQEEVETPEKVYISKVTPKGFTQVSEEEVKQESTTAEQADKTEQVAKDKLEQEKAAQEKAQSELAKQKQLAAEKAKAEADKKAQTAKAAEQAKQTISEDAKKAALDAKLAAESAKQIKSGWIVQVGVFTDQAGADKMSKSLSDKGFETSTTIVDTNKGPKTGTRVWLGPFEDREQASNAKQSLSDKTGTSGFVRAYP